MLLLEQPWLPSHGGHRAYLWRTLVVCFFVHVIGRTVVVLADVPDVSDSSAVLKNGDTDLKEYTKRVREAYTLPPFSMKIKTGLLPKPLRSAADEENSGFEAQIRSDGVRAEMIVVYGAQNTSTTGEVEHIRTLWDGKKLLLRHEIPNLPQEDQRLVVTASERGMSIREILATNESGDFLFGFIQGLHLSEILEAEGSRLVSVKEDVIGGDICRVLEIVTPNGRLDLWLGSDDWLARKWIFKQTTGDRYWIYRLPFEQVTDITTEVEGVTVDTISGRRVCLSGNCRETYRDADGTISTGGKQVVRSDINFSPDFVTLGAFVMDAIPNGTRVSHQDAPGIAHYWLDGEVVTRKAGPEKLAKLDAILREQSGGFAATRDGGTFWQWLFWGGLTVLIAAMVIYVRRQRMARG